MTEKPDLKIFKKSSDQYSTFYSSNDYFTGYPFSGDSSDSDSDSSERFPTPNSSSPFSFIFLMIIIIILLSLIIK